VPFTLGVREPRTSGSIFAKLRRHGSAVLGGAATFAILFGVVFGLGSAEARRLQAERALTQETELRRVSSVLTNDLDVALGELRSLAFWLEREPAFATSRFDEYSRRLLDQHSTLRATAVLKDDLITQVYPPHPQMLGLDLGGHRAQGGAVARLRRTREPLISGPVDLASGGRGLVLRVPVHRIDAGQPDSYWGHVAFVFDVTRMQQLLMRSERLLDAQLRLADADGLGATAKLDLGMAAGSGPAEQTLDILVPAEHWRISVWPGSPPASPVSLMFLAAGVVLSLLGGVAIGLLLSTSRRLHEQNDELQKLATTDPLTGAFNRRAVIERTEAELVLSQRTGKAFSVLLLDLDHFKAINDQYGHAVGDTALKVIVSTVKAELRQTDVVGRWGGEEFLIIAVQTPEQGALDLGERLRLRVAETPIPAGFGTIRLSASFGVAESSPSDTAESLIDRADQGLYQAKANGRNRCASVPVPASSHVNVIVPPRRSANTSEQGSA
jgi:diguanylate cyclase (GGDEF)-like protein